MPFFFFFGTFAGTPKRDFGHLSDGILKYPEGNLKYLEYFKGNKKQTETIGKMAMVTAKEKRNIWNILKVLKDQPTRTI